MPNDIILRAATVGDTEELLKIYAPYVEKTAISFEYTAPTQEEFKRRIESISSFYPYIAAESGGAILGYAYANTFKEREAYSRSVETTIYVRQDIKRLGIGRRLYENLETILKKQGIKNLNACIAVPETEDEYLSLDSVKFHSRMGYTAVGEFHKCAYKFGRWYNMVWMEKLIAEHDDNPVPLIPFPEIIKSAALT